VKTQLVIFDTDAELVERLRSQSANLPYISYAVGNGPMVTKSAGLDAIKVSLMESLDRFGFNPPYPEFEARVLKTPSPEVQRGLPRYAISGVALPNGYARNVRSELEIVISAMLKTIDEFNATGEDQILRVGILPESLSLNKLPPAEVFQTLDRIYREQGPKP
jgi:hypothetical protein